MMRWADDRARQHDLRLNGDGVFVYDGTTRYTQDVAAPLSQVLQTTQGSTTTDYVYGMERLAALTGSTKSWYDADGLGSVRLTLSDVGVPLAVVNYDRGGTVESGSVPTYEPPPSPALFALPAFFCYTLYSNRRVEVQRTAQNVIDVPAFTFYVLRIRLRRIS